jgi:hypothetical protein
LAKLHALKEGGRKSEGENLREKTWGRKLEGENARERT